MYTAKPSCGIPLLNHYIGKDAALMAYVGSDGMRKYVIGDIRYLKEMAERLVAVKPTAAPIVSNLRR